MGCFGVYPDVLWWVGGFSLDVRTHHVQRILKINSSFSGAPLLSLFLTVHNSRSISAFLWVVCSCY